MKYSHPYYCISCAEPILEKWKDWPQRKAVPLLPRLIGGVCEACGGTKPLKASHIQWLNYHDEFSTGLPDYWQLVIMLKPNKWGTPYLGESDCPRCQGRAVVSQMNCEKEGKACYNCSTCGVIPEPPAR